MLIQRIIAYRSKLTIWYRYNTQILLAIIVEITCKLRFFCIFIDYWIDYRKVIFIRFRFFFTTFITAFLISAIIFLTIYSQVIEIIHKNRLKNCLKNCLTKDFHDLHVCFIIKLNLWEKIYAISIYDVQIYTKNAYLRYSSSKLRFEEEKLCYDFDIRNNTYRFIGSSDSQVDITYSIILYALTLVIKFLSHN